MAIFFSQRNKPRQFGYLPRYYDPEQEARQDRRKQLHMAEGRTFETDTYKPGDIIRNGGLRNRAVRQRKTATGRPLRLIIIIAALLAGAYFIIRWQFHF